MISIFSEYVGIITTGALASLTQCEISSGVISIWGVIPSSMKACEWCSSNELALEYDALGLIPCEAVFFPNALSMATDRQALLLL